jgi:hypothetical protein
MSTSLKKRAFTGTKSRLKAVWARARTNPRWVLMDLLSRFVFVRKIVKSLYEKPGLPQPDVSRSQFQDLDAGKFLGSLNRDGFCTGLNLPRNLTQQLLKFAFESTCYGDANPGFGFRYAEKSKAQRISRQVFSQGTYLVLDRMQPLLNKLANDPLLLSIAGDYIGTTAVITGNRLWWVFATAAADYDTSLTTSFFHYDKDDYSALRMFFFLSRVDENNGPHVVVRGSHTRKRLSQLVSLSERSDREIAATYGDDKLMTICGAPGAGFAEDPFCFHKAVRPVSGDRLMLEIKYAARDYKIFPAPDRTRMTEVIDPMPTVVRRPARVF